MNLEEQLGIKLSVLIAGLVGGIVSLTYHEKTSFSRAILMITSGAATAAYLQPFAQSYFDLPEQFSVGLGFVLGLVSMRVIKALLTSSDKLLKDPLTLLKPFINKNGPRNSDQPSDDSD